jgi:Mor family transcriptional regulator
MTLPDNHTRSAVALQVITALTMEKNTLMNRYWQAPMFERSKIQDRLQQIEIDLAHAQDERRRARAGAPPAPGDYDPLRSPSRANSSNSDSSTRSQAWKSKVEAIKADYQQGQGLGKLALAEKYGLSPQQIRRVLRNEGEQSHPTAKLTEDQVRDILQRYQDSNGRRGIIKELADTFQVRKSTICDIIARRTWRSINFEISVPRKSASTRSK